MALFSRRWSSQTFNVKPPRLDAGPVEILSPTTALTIALRRALLPPHQQTRAPRKLLRSIKFVISHYIYHHNVHTPPFSPHTKGFFFSFLTYMYTPPLHRTEKGCLNAFLDGRYRISAGVVFFKGGCLRGIHLTLLSIP